MTRRPIVSLLPLLYINRGNSASVCHCIHYDPRLTTLTMGSKLTFVGDEVCFRGEQVGSLQTIRMREPTQGPGVERRI